MRAIDRRQRSLDFGSRTAAIPLAARRAVQPSPNYAEMSRFVRQVRANGRDALQQLQAMVNFALTDHERLARLNITDEDVRQLHPDIACLQPADRPVPDEPDLDSARAFLGAAPR